MQDGQRDGVMKLSLGGRGELEDAVVKLRLVEAERDQLRGERDAAHDGAIEEAAKVAETSAATAVVP